jgi:hypothetical protein
MIAMEIPSRIQKIAAPSRITRSVIRLSLYGRHCGPSPDRPCDRGPRFRPHKLPQISTIVHLDVRPLTLTLSPEYEGEGTGARSFTVALDQSFSYSLPTFASRRLGVSASRRSIPSVRREQPPAGPLSGHFSARGPTAA